MICRSTQRLGGDFTIVAQLGTRKPYSTPLACFFFAFGRRLPLASLDAAFHQSRHGPASCLIFFFFLRPVCEASQFR